MTHTERILATYPPKRALRLALYAEKHHCWPHVNWQEVRKRAEKYLTEGAIVETETPVEKIDSELETLLQSQQVIGCDTETHRIGPKQVAPPIVCLSAAFRPVDTPEEWVSEVISTGNKPELDGLIDLLFTNNDIKVFCNASFDLAVLCNYRPDLFPVIFEQLENGRIADIIIREKLLLLATTGDLRFMETPAGKVKIGFKLADLVKSYFGIDISANKDENDAWRLNYSNLDGVPVADWPVEAREYATDDAKYCVDIYNRQEELRQQIIGSLGIDPFKVESFRVAVAFALHLMTCWGVAIDAEAATKIEERMQKELSPERLNLLIETGILKPAVPAQPYAKGTKQHAPDCADKKNCNCPPKMRAEIKESVDMTKLRAYVEQLAAKNPQVQIKKTSPSERFPDGQTSVDSEWLEDHYHLDPVLEQYKHRQDLQKMVTTELPRMKWEGNWAEVVHPCFDSLKSTGRVSSYATETYPSFNCQNVDPDARNCYVPRAGHILCGVDYSQMELGTAAQTCLNLFGHSVLADKINAGIDPHAYLGSQLAFTLNPLFHESCTETGIDSAEKIYDAFMSCKSSDVDEIKALFKKYRTFAKPTGLGYPGGLGPATFVKYAKATYGVIVDEQTAADLRETWKKALPEFVEYFEYINTKATDPVNKDEEGHAKFCYTSPMGMYRAGCDYCACANGKALQTPSAEGALLAVFNVVRACYDYTLGSILFGKARPLMFIHDELISELPEDEHAAECAQAISEIMVAAMETVTPDVRAKAQPVLMRRWDKAAEPVFDNDGKLTVWMPKEQ